MVLESKFQSDLIDELRWMFGGDEFCQVLRGNSAYQPGVPDLFVVFEGGWIALECKKSRGARKQPNQDFFVEKLNRMCFAAVIYPENREEILDAIQQTFATRR